MTEYQRIGRQYLIDGAPVLSVTTILDMGFPKNGLTYWAANETAAAAVNGWDELAALDAVARYERLRKAPWQTRDAAAGRGTKIHEYGQQLAEGLDVDVPDALAGPVTAYARWLDAFRVEAVIAERPVFHAEHLWAGTPDLFANVSTREYGRELWELDIKTGKGVYDSHVLQLAAYRHAQVWLPAGKGAEAQPLPWAQRVGVIHVRPDDVELIEVSADGRAYKQFRFCHQTALWAQDVKRAYTDQKAWPIGRAMHGMERVSHAS